MVKFNIQMEDGSRKYRLLLLAIFLVALAIRVIHVISMMRGDPQFDVPGLDARWHDEWALEVAGGNIFGEGVYFRAPLYPMFLGLIYKIFGHSYLAGKLALSVLGSTGCVMTALVAGKCFADRRIGLAAGFILALWGTAIYFDGELLIEGFSSFLTISGILAMLAFARKKPQMMAIAGFIIGLSAIARPNVLVTLPVLLWYLAGQEKRGLKIVALIVGIMLPILPVTLKNYVKGNDFVLISSQAGINFHIGNNPNSDGKTAISPGPFGGSTNTGKYTDNVWVSSVVIAEKETGRKLKASEVSSFWSRKSFDYIKTSPASWAELMLKKTYFMFNGFEIPNNRDIYNAIKNSTLTDFLITRKGLALPLGILLPLAVTGMLQMLVFRQSSREALMLITFALFYAASIVLFFVTARYRVPLFPIISIFSAYAVFNTADAVRKCLKGKFIFSILSVLVIMIVSNTHAFGVREFEAREFYINSAEAFYAKGRYDEALKEMKKVRDVDPEFPRTYLNVGAILMQLNRLDEAESNLKKALELDPNLAIAHMNLGNLYLRQNNRMAEARLHHLSAARLDPNNPITHYNLARNYIAYGQVDLAVKELKIALDLKPDFDEARKLLNDIQ